MLALHIPKSSGIEQNYLYIYWDPTTKAEEPLKSEHSQHYHIVHCKVKVVYLLGDGYSRVVLELPSRHVLI